MALRTFGQHSRKGKKATSTRQQNGTYNKWPAGGSTTHADGSAHNNATPWSTATMGMVSDKDGHAAGLGLHGSIQSIDRAELKSTIVMAQKGAHGLHTDSMYVVLV